MERSSLGYHDLSVLSDVQLIKFGITMEQEQLVHVLLGENLLTLNDSQL